MTTKKATPGVVRVAAVDRDIELGELPSLAVPPAERGVAWRSAAETIWRRIAGRDRATHEAYLAQGWVLECADDPRAPARDDATSAAAAHGIYRRVGYRIPGVPAAVPALDDWVVVSEGRPAFRWAGPAMNWSHPLVSPWNPILAQDLTFSCLDFLRPGWPSVDIDNWTAEAIAVGRKPAGYFAGGSAARRGTLAQVYGRSSLEQLAGEYRRVLAEQRAPGGWVDETVVEPLLEHQDLPLQQLLEQLDDTPLVITGLTLGYPPEVTAGCLLHQLAHGTGGERRCGLRYAEVGALCGPDSEWTADLPHNKDWGRWTRESNNTRQGDN